MFPSVNFMQITIESFFRTIKWDKVFKSGPSNFLKAGNGNVFSCSVLNPESFETAQAKWVPKYLCPLKMIFLYLLFSLN